MNVRAGHSRCCGLLAAATAFAQNKHFGDWPAGTRPARSRQTRGRALHSHAAHGDDQPRPAGAALRARGHLDRRAAVRAGHQGRGPAQAPRRPLRSVPDRRTRRACRAPITSTARCSARCRSSCTCRSARFRYRVMGLAFADAQWDNPLPDGLTRPDALVDRRHVHDHGAAAAGVSRHRRREVPRARRARDGRVPREAAAAERPVLPRARRATFYWGRGDGWVAVGMAELLRELPAKHKAAQARARGVSEDDGDAAHAPGATTACGASSSTSGELGGDLQHGHVHLRLRHRREERLAAPRTPTAPRRARRGSRWWAISRPRATCARCAWAPARRTTCSTTSIARARWAIRMARRRCCGRPRRCCDS